LSSGSTSTTRRSWHVGEVADLAVEQLGVGDDHLVPVDRAQPSGLEPDCLDGAHRVAELHRLAQPKRPVENDRQRREQVGEDIPRGQADGDAADAEPRDDAGDIDAQVAEDQHGRDREQSDVDQQADDAQRVADRGLARTLAGARLNDPQDDLPRPHRRLDRQCDHKGDLDCAFDRRRRWPVSRDDLGRHGDHEEEVGPPQRRGDHRPPPRSRPAEQRRADRPRRVQQAGHDGGE
jgi:hypothetical protein